MISSSNKIVSLQTTDRLPLVTQAKRWWFGEAIDDYNGSGSPLNVKIGGSRKKITWHHHENGTHLIPVFTDVHTGMSHTGGVKTVELGINHLFNYLQ